jgi:hypothetical protein
MKHRPKILAVSSGGGHWIQLLRLRPALADCRVTYVTVDATCRDDVNPDRFYSIPDANRGTKFRLMLLTLRLLWLYIVIRPECVVSTGAAPGYIAVRIGKIFRTRTLFIDSIANAEQLSLSAHLALKHADLTLTQWKHLSEERGASFRGALL